MKHYLYRHVRLDTNKIFYIGIGTKPKSYKSTHVEFSRAYNKTIRNLFWKSIISKTSYKIEIMLESDDYNFIKEKEKEFIKLYGRRNLELGSLVNLTDGGDGNINAIVSEETKLKLKNSRKNRKYISGRKIYQYSLEGNFVKEWENITRASLFINVDKSTLQKVASKNVNNGYCKGYYWSFENVNKLIPKKYKVATFAKVQMIDPKTNVIIKTFDSKEQACRFLGKRKTGSFITNSIRTNKLAYGYVWKEVGSCV